MASREFKVVADLETFDGVSVTEGGRIPSGEDLKKLAEQISWYATFRAGVEAAAKLVINRLYYYRGKHGVHYVVVREISSGNVLAQAATKEGVVSGEVFQFFEPQRLVEPKEVKEVA